MFMSWARPKQIETSIFYDLGFHLILPLRAGDALVLLGTTVVSLKI